MKKLVAMMMAAALVAMTLTACGSSDSTTNTAASTEAATEESTAADTAEETVADTAEATDVAEATDGNVLIVGTNAEFPPFEYIGDDGEPDGFDIALIKAIGEKMGMEVQVENMEFASLVAAIGTKIDASIAGMTVTDERAQVVDFSDTYYDAVQSVIVAADSDIATADDLKGKSIGVQMGTTGNFIADDIEGATVQAYNKGVDAVNDLLNGRVDAVIIDTNPASVFAKNFEGQVVALDGAQFDFEPEHYAIALPKGSDLVEKVNAALAELKEDGTFDAIVDEYINN